MCRQLPVFGIGKSPALIQLPVFSIEKGHPTSEETLAIRVHRLPHPWESADPDILILK
jgi:hypothetical protein